MCSFYFWILFFPYFLRIFFSLHFHFARNEPLLTILFTLSFIHLIWWGKIPLFHIFWWQIQSTNVLYEYSILKAFIRHTLYYSLFHVHPHPHPNPFPHLLHINKEKFYKETGILHLILTKIKKKKKQNYSQLLPFSTEICIEKMLFNLFTTRFATSTTKFMWTNLHIGYTIRWNFYYWLKQKTKNKKSIHTNTKTKATEIILQTQISSIHGTKRRNKQKKKALNRRLNDKILNKNQGRRRKKTIKFAWNPEIESSQTRNRKTKHRTKPRKRKIKIKIKIKRNKKKKTF